jgi:hypothetical protein
VYKNGYFYPGSKEAGPDFVGKGRGKGFNVNIGIYYGKCIVL